MLYQQGTQRIEVIVRKESSGGTAGTKETEAEKTSQANVENNENLGSGATGLRASKLRFIKTNVTHAIAVGKQVADFHIEHWISGIGMESGDQALQDQINRKVEVIQDVTGIASAIVMGATYGSAGGPWGAVLGAAFGGISTGASTAFKYANRKRDYNYKVFKEENAVEYNRARANIDLTNGRLR